MEAQLNSGNTARMGDETRHELMDKAERLALEVFGENAEAEHIEAVFEHLTWCWCRGLPPGGAATVH